MLFHWISRDGKLLVAARGMRTLGQATISVLLAIYLDKLGFSLFQIGAFISAGLAGAALYAFLVGLLADLIGRRRLLVAFTLMSLITILALVFTESFPLLAFMAFVGSLSAAGPGGGPHQPLEQAILSAGRPGVRGQGAGRGGGAGTPASGRAGGAGGQDPGTAVADGGLEAQPRTNFTGGAT